MSNKVIKSVSFNITVADDSLILKHVKRRNFSGYVKKLILADIKANKASSEVVETVSEQMSANVTTHQKEPAKASDTLEQMRQQKKSEPSKPPTLFRPK